MKKTILFLALAVIGGLSLVYAENSEANQSDTRAIYFPEDRPLGTLQVRDINQYEDFFDGWVDFCEARGKVRLPAGKELRLNVSETGVPDLSPLSNLSPNDLYMLSLGRTEVTDTCLSHLAGLTGLKVLILNDTKITNRGLLFIKKLRLLINLSLMHTQIDDNGLANLSELKSLKVLSLGDTRITDTGLSHIAELSSLEELQLWGTNISDDGLIYLKSLTSLKILNLANTSITDMGLSHLSSFTAMENLRLSQTLITDDGLTYLKPMSSLKNLWLDGTKVGDDGLAHLRELNLLESVELPDKVTDRGLAYLSELPSLKGIDLMDTFTEEGLKHLAKMHSLEELNIVGKFFTDVGMSYIAKLTNLTKLSLQNCPITNDGLAKLTALKSLQELTLHNGMENMKITSSGLAYLGELPLTLLYLYKIKIDESRLTYIARLTQLKQLGIEGMPLYDEDLASLSKLVNLRYLVVNSDTISDGGIVHLVGLAALEDLTLWVPMTDVGFSYLSNLKSLEHLQVKGDFSDKGLAHLEKLKALRSLRITSGYDFSPTRLKQLQKELPALQTFKVMKSREIKSRPEIGEVAPKFSLQTLDGKGLKLEDYRGKVVLLYFWATWCSPCVASTPELKKFYEELSQYDGFAMVSLSCDRDEDRFEYKRYVERNKLTWSQVRLGLHSQVAADYGVSGVPAYILVGPDGKVLLSQERDWDKIKAAVANTLGASEDKKPDVQVEGKED